MADHRHLAGGLLGGEHRLRVGQAVGQRNFHLHVLAGLEAGDRLGGVHLGGRAEDHGVDVARERLGELGAGVVDPVLGGDGLGGLQPAADEADHLHALDLGQAVEVLLPEGAGAGEGDLHAVSCGRNTMWPTAVLLAGTW